MRRQTMRMATRRALLMPSTASSVCLLVDGEVARLFKKPAAPEVGSGINVKIVTRTSPATQYIMLNNKYLGGCTLKGSPSYQDIVGELATLLKSGQVFTNLEARGFIANAIAVSHADALVLRGLVL